MFSHGVLQILIFVVALICYSSIIIEQQIIATTKIRIWKSRCQNISVHYHLPPLLLMYACWQSSYLINNTCFWLEGRGSSFWFLPIPANSCRFLPIPADSCWVLLFPADSCWVLLRAKFLANLTRSLSTRSFFDTGSLCVGAFCKQKILGTYKNANSF